MPRRSAHQFADETGASVDEQFDRYRATGDPSLRNRLVEIHLPVADRCARRYLHRGEPLADLMQVARMALVRAVERYEPSRGVRFESYAVPTIVGELRHHFRDRCWIVAVPRSVKDLRSQVFRANDQLGQTLGRQPSAAEIAETLDISEDRVTGTMESNRHYRATSWDAVSERSHQMARPEGPGSTGDIAADSSNRVDVERSIACLDERLRSIIVWRFYEECTQREIGERLGVGQVQVSRLLSRALAELRQRVEAAVPDGHAAG